MRYRATLNSRTSAQRIAATLKAGLKQMKRYLILLSYQSRFMTDQNNGRGRWFQTLNYHAP